MADEPRVLVQVRLQAKNVKEIDGIAEDQDWTRSQVLRTLFSLGLKAWKRGER